MVYVDSSRWRLGRMHMCHMIADTVDELHDMADRLGMKRERFQGDHYDICKSNRVRAITMGAIEVNSRIIVQIRRRLRTEACSSVVEHPPPKP